MGINVVVGNYFYYICICVFWFGIYFLLVGCLGLILIYYVLFFLEFILFIVEIIVFVL